MISNSIRVHVTVMKMGVVKNRTLERVKILNEIDNLNKNVIYGAQGIIQILNLASAS